MTGSVRSTGGRRARRVAPVAIVGTVVALVLAAGGARPAFAVGTVGTATPADPVTDNPLAIPAPGLSSTQQFAFGLSATSGEGSAYCSSSTPAGSTEEDSYFVPSTVDPSTLTFVAGAPTGPGQFNLYASTPFAAVTNIDTAASGQVVAIPADMEFGPTFAGTVIPGGQATSWNAGIACAAPPAAGGPATVTDYWNCVLSFSPSPDDPGGNGYTWTYNCGSTTVVPESPLAVGLPLAGAAVLGGVALSTRRRRGRRHRLSYPNRPAT